MVSRIQLVFICWLLGLLIAQTSRAQPRPPAKAAPAAAPARTDDTAKLPDSLAQRVERAYFMLGRINGAVRRSADTRDLGDDLPPLEDNLETIQQNLDLYGNVVDVKQLQMYRVLLADMQEQLGGWRTTLQVGSQQLAASQGQLRQLAALLPPADTLPPPTTAVGRALARLRAKQTAATRLLVQRHQAVTGLQTRVSESYILALELQDEVREQMGRFQRRNSQAELPPLWQPGSIRADDQAAALVRKSYAAQRKLVSYYFAQHWDYWGWMAVLALGFFGWVFRNFRRLRALAAAAPAPAAVPELRLHYLRPWPVAAALLVVFSLAPFFDLSPPAAYTDLLQLLLLLTLTVLGWRSWPRALFWYWLGIVACFFALTIAYAGRAPGLGLRLAMLLLNLGAAGLGWRFWRWLRQHRLLAGFVRPVVLLFIALQALAVLANLYGRVSLAKMFSTTAVIALTQAISLSGFVRVFIEAFYLQAQCLQLAGGAGARLSFGKVESGLRKALTVVVGVLWLMLVSSNLNLYNLLFRLGSHALTAPHQLGSTSFTLGNILLFFGLIFLTVQVQRYVGYAFGSSDDDDFSADENRKGSWLVAIRLGILAVGLFIATLASGLPVDKLPLCWARWAWASAWACKTSSIIWCRASFSSLSGRFRSVILLR